MVPKICQPRFQKILRRVQLPLLCLLRIIGYIRLTTSNFESLKACVASKNDDWSRLEGPNE